MKDEAEKESFEPVLQALGALEWVLVQIVFNVRARTAVGLRQHLAQAGIEIPNSVIESSKWFTAFHRAPSVANHEDGFGGLLLDRLTELGFEEEAAREAIKELEKDAADLCLAVQSAVARELRGDLEAIGVRVPPSILDSVGWRDVFARQQGKLPAGAASIVENGTDSSVFQAVEQ